MIVHDVLSIELLAREVDLVKEVLGELLARTVAEVALRAPRDSVGHGWGFRLRKETGTRELKPGFQGFSGAFNCDGARREGRGS